ncbi:hypothetical protein QFZ20_000714 [Flavobacterium sp. W4I14]|nr:hypothetical protein [Flavobacterium sp. W4I14]
MRNLPANRVKDYIIKTPTHKVKDGRLKPIKLPGCDRFCVKNLLAAYLESKQNGRI